MSQPYSSYPAGPSGRGPAMPPPGLSAAYRGDGASSSAYPVPAPVARAHRPMNPYKRAQAAEAVLPDAALPHIAYSDHQWSRKRARRRPGGSVMRFVAATLFITVMLGATFGCAYLILGFYGFS